jgi:hypothetical protein
MKINCFQANEVKHDGADYFESAFGMFFVFIDRVSSQAILWPLVAARGTSITCLLLLVHMRGEFHVPEKNQLGLMALVGLFDAAGNTFFALATRMGRLDISVVLSSLYPATTVVLAWLVLKEKQGTFVQGIQSWGTFVQKIHNLPVRSSTSGFLPDAIKRVTQELVTPGFLIVTNMPHVKHFLHECPHTHKFAH